MQEIGSWSTDARSVYKYHTLFTDNHSDVGFLIPKRWLNNALLRHEEFGPYWRGLALGQLVHVTAHFVDQSAGDEGQAMDIINGTLAFVATAKSLIGPTVRLVVSFDANTTFPRFNEHCTGGAILPPLPTHSAAGARLLLGWLEKLGVWVVNTFSHYAADPETLWTCGVKKPLERRSHIDYIACDFEC